MATGAPADSIILKVLNGVQSGVEVVLPAGEYSIGTGPDDDVQLIDVSLKPGHLRLRLSPARIEVAGGAGSLRTHAGLAVEAGSEWQTVEPLDIVTAGTTRFALGPPSAQWATVADDDGAPAAPPSPGGERAKGRAGGRWAGEGAVRSILMPVLALLVVTGAALWYALVAQADPSARPGAGLRDDVQAVRAVIADLPFAPRIEVRQDVDGAIFVSGYTDTLAERRALVAAVERTAVPARMRVWVTETMRSEIENLVRAEKANVTASLSPAGVATLDGLILNETAARRLVDLLRDQVLGVAQVESRIRTARTLLSDVERLARASQIAPNVLFRLDGELVEANGAMPVEKVDAWVGFLQAYSQRFAPDIPLRSFVQLQTVTLDSGGPVQPVNLGGRAGASDGLLDIERLRRGQYTLDDIFAGPKAKPAPPQGMARTVVADASGTLPALGTDGPVVTPDGARSNDTARRLVERWRDGLLGTTGNETAVKRALDALAAAGGGAERGTVAARLLPLFADPRRRVAANQKPCWPEARLTQETLPTALFWLDLASVSDAFTLKSLDLEMQSLVVEAAMNPTRTARCAKAHGEVHSGVELPNVYLTEIARNPGFVRFITRDMPGFPLDVSGVNLGPGRYIQVRNGQILREGSAPDSASRIALVAELGVAVQLKEGLAASIFGPEVNWVATP